MCEYQLHEQGGHGAVRLAGRVGPVGERVHSPGSDTAQVQAAAEPVLALQAPAVAGGAELQVPGVRKIHPKTRDGTYER